MLDINNGQVAFFRHGGGNEELAAVAECHRLNSVAEEADFVDQLVLYQVVQIDECTAMAARFSLSRSQDPLPRVTSQRRKSHLRVYQDSLWVTSPRAFNNDLVVQSVGDHARGWRPEQIVMHTTESIVAIHCEGLNDLALPFFHNLWPLFDLDVHLEATADTDELIERKLALDNLLIIVLGDASGIHRRNLECERAEPGLLPLLYFELWQDEGELSQLGLSLLSHGGPHALKYSRLMELVQYG